MTTNCELQLPFALTYGERIEGESEPFPVCYQRDRQISQVFTDGGWVDAVAHPDVLAGTRKTGVPRETTDDD